MDTVSVLCEVRSEVTRTSSVLNISFSEVSTLTGIICVLCPECEVTYICCVLLAGCITQVCLRREEINVLPNCCCEIPEKHIVCLLDCLFLCLFDDLIHNSDSVASLNEC
jgi:hypothetical protein